MDPEWKRHKTHTKGLFINAERIRDCDQSWCELSRTTTEVNVNINTTIVRGKGKGL